MDTLAIDNLIYNWGGYEFNNRTITVFDTTLRDGLQSTQVNRQPTLEEKISFLALCADIGIEAVEIGFPIASEAHKHDVLALAKYANENRLQIKLSCLSRTLRQDVEAVAEVSQKAGIEVTANLLVASSKIRHVVENWQEEKILDWISNSIAVAHEYNLPIEFVTEDTTRSDPQTLKKFYTTAIEKGAQRIWIADTVGDATPNSAKNLTNFFIKDIIGNEHIGLDWHGHDDKGLSVANALAAVEAGADRIQATALGVGERAGNTPMEQILLNLVLANNAHYDLKKLALYSQLASSMFQIPIRDNYPAIGKFAHATAAGMHAAAIHKAKKLERPDLAENVYSSFQASLLGQELKILIGPMSGISNVAWNLDRLGIPYDNELCERILHVAKEENKFLSDEEILLLARNR